MTLLRLTRRSALMLPLALAACGGEDDNQTYAPLSWDYLPPLKLNVASIAIEQRFANAGQRGIQVLVGKLPLPAQVLEYALQLVCKVFKHT